jgi:hypothetical protein
METYMQAASSTTDGEEHEVTWTPERCADVRNGLPEGTYFKDQTAYLNEFKGEVRLMLMYPRTHVNRVRTYLRDKADIYKLTFMGAHRLGGHGRRNTELLVLYGVEGGRDCALEMLRTFVRDMHIARFGIRVALVDGWAATLQDAAAQASLLVPDFVTPTEDAAFATIRDGSAAQEGDSEQDTATRMGISLAVYQSVAWGAVPVRFVVVPGSKLPGVLAALDEHPVLGGAIEGHCGLITFVYVDGVDGVFWSAAPSDTFHGNLNDAHVPAGGAGSRAYYKLREAFLRGGIAPESWFNSDLAQRLYHQTKAQRKEHWRKQCKSSSSPQLEGGSAAAAEPVETPPPGATKRVTRAADLNAPARLVHIAERVSVEWDSYGPEGPPVHLDAVVEDAHRSRDARALVCDAPVRVAIDVGAAPGGWSRVLANNVGAQLVIAVDPAELAPDMPEQVVHIQKRFQAAVGDLAALPALAANRAELGDSTRFIDCYVCDMNVPVSLSLRLLWEALPYLTGHARVAFTVKNFNNSTSSWRDAVRHAQEALALVALPGTVRHFHLLSNGREEQTVMGVLRGHVDLQLATTESLEAILATRWVGDKMSSDEGEIASFKAAQKVVHAARDKERRAAQLLFKEELKAARRAARLVSEAGAAAAAAVPAQEVGEA